MRPPEIQKIVSPSEDRMDNFILERNSAEYVDDLEQVTSVSAAIRTNVFFYIEDGYWHRQ